MSNKKTIEGWLLWAETKDIPTKIFVGKIKIFTYGYNKSHSFWDYIKYLSSIELPYLSNQFIRYYAHNNSALYNKEIQDTSILTSHLELRTPLIRPDPIMPHL